MPRDCCVALPRGAMGLSAVCDCGISYSYSLAISNSSLLSICSSANLSLFKSFFVYLYFKNKVT